MPSKEKFPDFPQFYGAQPGAPVAPPSTNSTDWATAQRQAVPPAQPPLIAAILEMLRRLNMGVSTRP